MIKALLSTKQHHALSLILNGMSDLFFLMSVDEDGHFRYVTTNEPALRTLGLTRDCIGKTIEEVVGEEKAAVIIQEYQEAILSKEEVVYQHKLQNADKKIIYWETKVTPLFNEEGACSHILAIARDITEEVKAKKQAEENIQRYRSLFDYSLDPIFSFDLEGRFLSANPITLELLGCAEEEILRQHFAPLIHPEDLSIAIENFQLALQGNPQTYQVRIYNKRRELKYIEVSNVPTIIDGKMISIFGVAKDITKQKRVEQELLESETKYRLIAEHSTDMIKVITPNGNVAYASPSHERYLGYSADYYLNRSIMAFTHPDDLSILFEAIQKALTQKEEFNVEIRRQHENGDWIWVESNGAPVVNTNGEVESIVVIARDITEKKHYEEELARLAYHDHLTGLPNRRLLHEKLDYATRQSERTGKPMALMVMDLDGFKRVNDTFGHDTGDEVIKEFALRLQNTLRETDTVSRIGGDEFVVVLPDLNESKCVHYIAERILNAVREPWHVGEHTLELTTSIGISFHSIHHQNQEELFKEADTALYKAKEEGKNRYIIA